MSNTLRTNYQHFFSAKHSGNILVVVLVIMVVGITIATMSLALVISTTQSLGGAMEGERLRAAVEGGVENAILNILRNPGYSGEDMTIDGLPVAVEVTTGVQTTIVATASNGAHRQRYQVVLERVAGVLTVVSWQQID